MDLEHALLQLAQALENLTITARDGKTQPAEMANGTITITNVGSFGMDTGTPILNPDVSDQSYEIIGWLLEWAKVPPSSVPGCNPLQFSPS